jgi:hypothetical protein
MKHTTFVSVLMASSLCAAFAAAVRWRQGAASGFPDRVTVPTVRWSAGLLSDDSLSGAEDAIVGNDPFRLSNSPPAVRYDPAADAAPAGALITPQLRPSLVLKAIVGGPPWQAVIDGIPGHPSGTLARAGSKFDRLTVRVVTRDSVVVQGMDTSWVLSFRAR